MLSAICLQTCKLHIVYYMQNFSNIFGNENKVYQKNSDGRKYGKEKEARKTCHKSQDK